MSLCDPAPPSALPPGFRLVPLFASQAQATVRLAVIVRVPAKGPASLVPVRQLFDGRAVLGALIDRGDRVLSFLDVAVQSVQGLASAPTVAGGIDNAGLDRRWAADARAMAAADEGAILTGFEHEHPLPTFLDVASGEAIHPVDPASGAPLRLCTDDRDLQDAGLPPFSRTLHRYLRADDAFVAVTDGAPTNDRTRGWADVLGEDHGLVPLNPEAGLLRVSRHSPLDVESLLRRLTQQTPDPLPVRPRALVETDQPSRDDAARPAQLFLSSGRSGRLVESLHLRLRMLAEAVEQVSIFTRQTQRPLLNLTDTSFRVRTADPRAHLPLLWTSGLQLTDGGAAVRLPLPEGIEAFVADAAGGSVYRPREGDRRVEGQAEIRLRQFLDRSAPETGQVIAEGTLVTDERLSPAGRDLLWLRLPLAHRPLDVFAHLSRDESMPAREWRLRTLALSLDDATTAALRDLEGRPLRVPFALIPHLSSPADLYGLGVLGARLLLTGDDQSLPVAVDELLSLGESVVEAGVDEQHSVAGRIAEALAREARYQRSLGPQRLEHAPLPFADALDLVPLDLWSQALATVLAMFPGRAGVSHCRSFSDAAPGALHRVYDPAIASLERLLVLSRSLIVIDWRFNREVSTVLRRVETKL